MKYRSTFQKTGLIAGVFSVCLLFSQAIHASGKPVSSFSRYSFKNPGEEDPAKKSKSHAKNLFSRNNSSVKIYSDPIKRIMHVVAKENEGKEIDFFVFDLEGTLIRNHRMKANDHIKIQGLQRGVYIYRVFTGDEETASGRFDIR